MAYQLVAEVLDHAPADLTPAERLALVAIAEWVRAGSRRCARPAGDLAARVGVSPESIGKVLLRLKRHGLEVRVAIGKDKHGEAVYAVPGRVSTFELPPLPAPAGCSCQTCKGGPSSDLEGGPSSDLEDKGGPASGQGGRGSGQGGPGSDPSRSRSRDEDDEGAPRCAAPHAAEQNTTPDDEELTGFGVRTREIADAVAHVVRVLDEPEDVARTAVHAWLADKDSRGQPVDRPALYVRSFVQDGKSGQLRKFIRQAPGCSWPRRRPATLPSRGRRRPGAAVR